MPNELLKNDIEKRLWDAADQLRANSKLKSSEYAVPVLGLIFLKYADYKFSNAKEELEKKHLDSGSRRSIGKADFQAKGILYLPESARFENLLKLPEGENIGKAINDAMKDIEAENVKSPEVAPHLSYKLTIIFSVFILLYYSSWIQTACSKSCNTRR